MLNATRQVIDRIPAVKSPSTLSTLFLQLTVDDMGICVPVTSVSQVVLIKNFNILFNMDLASFRMEVLQELNFFLAAKSAQKNLIMILTIDCVCALLLRMVKEMNLDCVFTGVPHHPPDGVC